MSSYELATKLAKLSRKDLIKRSQCPLHLLSLSLDEESFEELMQMAQDKEYAPVVVHGLVERISERCRS